MITKYGFSERLGPVVYGTSQEETFLGRDFGQGKGYSETTAAEIDSEMRDIIDEAYETCRRKFLHRASSRCVCKDITRFLYPFGRIQDISCQDSTP